MNNKKRHQSFNLSYKPLDVQGQCLLKSIRLVKKNQIKFILYVILCILTLGIPRLLIFWYPKLERYFYFEYTHNKFESTHFWIKNYDDQVTIVQKVLFKNFQVQSQLFQAIGFTNRYIKYYLDNHQTIKAIKYNSSKKIRQLIHQQKLSGYKGLSFDSASLLIQCYGLGAMILQKPSLFKLFTHQIFRPMFLFIIYSIIVWIITQYFYYVFIIIISMVISLTINLYQTNKLNNKIHQMAYYEAHVDVLRQGRVIRMSSIQVVPGDIVFFNNNDDTNGFKIPFDGKVLDGSILINQCSLTGQSVPIVKKGCKDLNDIQNDKGCIIFEGTTIIQVNSHHTFTYFQKFREIYGVPVCVHKTNFYTNKGSLIRIIKFPKEQQNIFQKQSSKFLILIFFFTLITYGILAHLHKQVVLFKQIMLKIMQLVTITVPPGLPVSMTLGVIYAVDKLQNKNIYCTSQNNIIKGGRVEHICFDKTGTLTQNFMDFYGFLSFSNKKFNSLIKKQDLQKNQNILKKYGQIENMKTILYNFGSNNSLIQNMKTKQIIGDPMELKVFQFGRFQFDYASNKNQEVMFAIKNEFKIEGEVYKVFEFDSDVQRMSVICKTKQNEFYLFTKGSPQVLKTLFDTKSFEIRTYEQQLKSYSSQGYRILAIGCKKIGLDINKSRQQLEKGIIFQGFTIFENMLKPESHNAILQLKQADIQCSMITGDSSLTACCIGLDCQIADRDKRILIFDKSKEFIRYQEFNSSQKQSQLKIQNDLQLQEKVIDIVKKFPDHQLCLTGNIFHSLFQNKQEMIYRQELRQIFERTKIFARAKPNQKAKIISIYQSFGKIMGMCGDGANDCGALKQAQIGLSLSQTQASISAPFTSKVFNIYPMVELIKQCRAALATNFSLFNIMIIYSLIQYTSSMICQYYYSYPNDFKFVYWDIAGNFLLLLTYGNIQTAQKLTKQKPLNSLFSFSNVFQLLTMFIIQLIGQCIIIYLGINVFSEKIDYFSHGGTQYNINYYQKQGFFFKDGSEPNILFLFTNFFYLSTFVGFSIQNPWRKRFYTCLPFLITFLIVGTYSTLIILVPAVRLPFWQLQFLTDFNFNLVIFCLSGIFSWIMYSNQKYILEPVTNWLRKKSKFVSQIL